MPAPPIDLVAALREGTVFRHLFFTLEHPSGTVRAWDGVGEIEFGGEVFYGVGGFANINGVSNSGDIQNHKIECTLIGVPFDAIRSTNPVIRDQPATIDAVWLDEGASVLASRRVFAGSGDYLALKTDRDTVTLQCFLKGASVDWAMTPRSYYSPTDQRRLHPGDSGCDLVPSLENAEVAGWQTDPDAATSGAYVFGPSTTSRNLMRSTDLRFVGVDVYGIFFTRVGGEMFLNDGVTPIIEDVTGSPVIVDASGEPATADGSRLFFDVDGNVVSAVGNAIRSGDVDAANRRLRILNVAGTSASSGFRMLPFGSGTNREVRVSANDFSTSSPSSKNRSLRVFDEFDTGNVHYLRGNFYFDTRLRNRRTNRNYVEEGTNWKIITPLTNPGTPDGKITSAQSNGTFLAAWNGAGFGFDEGNFQTKTVSVASDGTLRTSSGNFIVQEGFSSTDESRLRIWV